MSAMEDLYTALSSTGYEVAQRPAQGEGEAYLSFFLLGQRETMRSNAGLRVISWFQIDLFSREAAGPGEIGAVRDALRSGGFAIRSVGPAMYEQDTRWHHLVFEAEKAD